MTHSPMNSLDISMLGNLENWPLVEVLSWLHNGHKTAIVRVGEGINAGMMFLSEGFLYRAEWAHLTGEQALFALMGVSSGAFAIMQRSIPDARPNIRSETGELLLRCAIARDGMTRLRPASA